MSILSIFQHRSGDPGRFPSIIVLQHLASRVYSVFHVNGGAQRKKYTRDAYATAYLTIAVSALLGGVLTCDGVGNCEISQPPPSALINATAPNI